MVLCLLSRGSRGHWTKFNHEKTVGGPEIASKKSKIFKAPTMNECEEARGLRSFAFQEILIIVKTFIVMPLPFPL